MSYLSVDEPRDATITKPKSLKGKRQADHEGFSEEDHNEGDGYALKEIFDAFHVYIIAPTQGDTRD